MLDRFQALIMADAVTARFLAFYIGGMVVLYVLSFAFGRNASRAAPARSHTGPRPSGSRIQRMAKSVAVRFANWIASLAITPNQITLVGLLLVMLCCGLFLYHRNTFVFGSSLIVAYLFDTLDGVVARAQGKSTLFGAYLDAVVDRYQEVATFLAIGVVTQLWVPTFLVMTGSMLTSYNKARTAMEVPIDNKAWPDLLEKPTRMFILCLALIGDNTLPWILPGALWALAVMTNFTAMQRVMRSFFIIQAGGQSQSSRMPAGPPAGTARPGA